MAKTILLSGYTKQKNVSRIRSFFPEEEIILACAYIRQPLSEPKQTYLQLFDVVFDLTKPEDVERLKEQADDISCITCTQERDMVAYIQALLLCKKISPEQSEKYTAVIGKHTFKESIGTVHPELVPSHHVVNDILLANLESLTYPQIIKPSGLAGSIMIRAVHSPEEFKEHYDAFAGKINNIANEYYAKEVEIITESFVEGPQYSVNTYINAKGDITFCPMVRVVTPQEMGINDSYSVFQYTTDELSEDEVESLHDAVGKIATHFELKNTSAHFDAVLNNGQWQFFEVGLRYGGHRQRLYELSHCMDTFRNDIYNRLGIQIVIPEQKKNACILQKCVTEHGILESISYNRVIQEEKTPLILESKMAKVGSEVMPLSLGGGTITRHFIVGSELSKVLETSRQLFDSIKLTLK
jgi:hypothetical protein